MLGRCPGQLGYIGKADHSCLSVRWRNYVMLSYVVVIKQKLRIPGFLLLFRYKSLS